MKTASRILGTAFFIEGFEVQDAPLYGAERRGAPICAYVRAGREAEETSEVRFVSAVCAGAAAALTGVISKGSLSRAIGEEIGPLGPELVEKNRDKALEAFALMEGMAGSVNEGVAVRAEGYEPPEWIDLPLEGSGVSAPAIHAPATSELMETGLWRTLRPVIDYDTCNRCWWLCSTFCP